MPEERVIQTARSADLVTSKILVDGEVVPSTVQVLNIVVEKELNRVPTATLFMRDGDPAAQDFPLSNQDLFLPGKEIEIKAGYHSDEETLFKGIVIKHSLKIRNNQSLLIIECKDKALKLTVGRKSNYYSDSSDSEILESIIDRYGLEKEVESTSLQHKKMVQYNVTDWDFCMARAQANGMVVAVDNGKMFIKRPGTDQEEVATVAFGATLLDFDAEIDARHQFSKVTSYSWNAGQQELLEIEAENPSLRVGGNIPDDDLSSVIGLENLELKNGGAAPDVELQAWADAKLLFNRLAKVRGKVKFQGIPQIKPDTVIQLQGVGERMSGKVYVSAVRHQITEGNWTVDAQFGMNPKWFSETADMNDVAAAGLVAAVNGLQIGIVSQLESDPDGEDRILIKLPVVNNNEQGIWARVSTLDAGSNRGSFFRPEIGDEVIVGFINANPNDAIVLGMMNSSAKPAPIVATDDNHEKGFVTRSEMKLVFNDDVKSVILETPAGKKITIDEGAGIIQIEDDNSNKITLDSGGMVLESASDISVKATGDLTLEGTNVTIKASAQFKAEGSAGSEVSSGATTILKGSMVQIN